MLKRRLVPYFILSFGLITTSQIFYKDCFKTFLLCLMLSETYYVQNYAGIIGLGIGTVVQKNQNTAESIWEKKVKLFCFTCQLLTCKDCTLVKHQDHYYNFINAVADNERKDLSHLTVAVDSLEVNLKTVIGTMQSLKRSESGASKLRYQTQY